MIYYQKELDYSDFKLSLKYNNSNLQKIALDDIKIIPPKLTRQLCKYNLSGIMELKLKELPLVDAAFLVFKERGGLLSLFPKLKTLKISGNLCFTYA